LDQVYDESDYDACNEIADYARTLGGVVGISTQSNAERAERTVAILPGFAAKITALVDYWGDPSICSSCASVASRKSR